MLLDRAPSLPAASAFKSTYIVLCSFLHLKIEISEKNKKLLFFSKITQSQQECNIL